MCDRIEEDGTGNPDTGRRQVRTTSNSVSLQWVYIYIYIYVGKPQNSVYILPIVQSTDIKTTGNPSPATIESTETITKGSQVNPLLTGTSFRRSRSRSGSGLLLLLILLHLFVCEKHSQSISQSVIVNQQKKEHPPRQTKKTKSPKSNKKQGKRKKPTP